MRRRADILQLGFIVPLGAQPEQCFNEITPNDMYTSLTCAWSGAFILSGALTAVAWVLIRALSMHLQICWDVYVMMFARPSCVQYLIVKQKSRTKILLSCAAVWLGIFSCDLHSVHDRDRRVVPIWTISMPYQPQEFNGRLLGLADRHGCNLNHTSGWDDGILSQCLHAEPMVR